MSKPVAGQWYEYDGEDRVWCIGNNFSGVPVMQYQCGSLFDAPESDWELLKHLPDCTGWDWEPETFPQYWTTIQTVGNAAFVKRVSKESWFVVYKNGSEGLNTGESSPWSEKYRTRLTEHEALALLDKPQPPAESPDDWVTQDVVQARLSVDEYRCEGSLSIIDQKWRPVLIGSYPFDYCYKHGKKVNGGTLELRCRRRDLPQPAPSKRTITIPKWLVIYSTGESAVIEQSAKPLGFREVHRVGETTYEID